MRLRDQKSVFVDQAETISTEIQRVAILQQEEWYFAYDIG